MSPTSCLSAKVDFGKESADFAGQRQRQPCPAERLAPLRPSRQTEGHDRASGGDPSSCLRRVRPGGDDLAQGWRASFVSADDELPLQDDDLLAWCPECAEREFVKRPAEFDRRAPGGLGSGGSPTAGE